MQTVQKAKEVQVKTLAGEAFRETIELRGTALADKSSILNSEVGGVVAEILVTRGQHVKKGQVLVRFDRRGFALGVQQAQAGVEAAQAQARLVQTELGRTKQLVSDGAAPGSAFDQLSAQGDATGAQVRVAKAAAARARKALSDADLRAPYDGVITEIFMERGEMATVMPPKPVVQIVDITQLQVQAFAPEDSGGLAVVGAAAEVEVESAGVTARGVVKYVSSAIQNGARTFELRIAIDNPDEKIKAGSLARVRIAGPSNEAAILVPMGAVLRDEKDAPYVYVAEKGVARKKAVRLGVSQGARVLVREGLTAGEQLIAEGAGELSDGQPVATTVR
ncbi:MAG: efflux RND transporter periplasmic adaptor subunit [Deltaproteobacteria bacterium]|nr:efflux RND transporter periplasmic adaptor subunit [Deltaproteobacteria bacterium]